MYTITSPTESRTATYDGSAVMISNYLARNGEPVTISPPIQNKRALAAMGRILSENYPAGERIHLGVDPAWPDSTVLVTRNVDASTEILIDGEKVEPVSFEEMKSFITDELGIEMTESQGQILAGAVTHINLQDRLVSIGTDPDVVGVPTIAPWNLDEMESVGIVNPPGHTADQLAQLEVLAQKGIAELRKLASHAGLKNAYKGGFDKAYLVEFIVQNPVS